MTRNELQNKIRDILNRKDITIRPRYAKTKVGECWGTFVSLYGTFDVLSTDPFDKDKEVVVHYDNESLAYAMNNKQIVKDLQLHNLNAFQIYRSNTRNNHFEIVIQVSSYYTGEGKDEKRGYDFYDGAYPITSNQIGGTHRHCTFKMVNHF